MPGAAVVEVEVRLIVKSKAEASVEADPSDGGPIGMAEVGGGAGAPREFTFEFFPIGCSAFKNKVWFAGEQGERSRAGLAGFQKHKALARPQSAGGFLRRGQRCRGRGRGGLAFHGEIFPKVPPGVDVLLLEKSAEG